MLAIECSPTKIRHRQKSTKTASLTCTKSISYKILENYGHETFTHMRMFVCLHICVSPSVLNQRIDLHKIDLHKSHSASGRITSIKNSNDSIKNRTCSRLACRTVPQPTVPPCFLPKRYHKFGHDCFLPHPSQFIIH